MNVNFLVSGMDDWYLNLKLFDEKVRKEVAMGMKQEVMKVTNRAKQNLQGQHGHKRHWQTGTLSRSLRATSQWISHVEIEGMVATDVPYAPYVEAMEDGFLLPALYEMSEDIYVNLRIKMQKAIEGIG